MFDIQGYYNTYKSADCYTELLYRAGQGSQSREQNEVQSIINARITKLANALFADGDIISGAQIMVDAATGLVSATAGKIFMDGRIWDVEAREIEIPVTGTVSVGLRIFSKVISEVEDPGLRNPAIGQRAEGLPGAWRLKEWAEWGWNGDGGEGTFYPVYSITDGVAASKEAPPALDSFNQAIARYDRDSTGDGTYVCNGCLVTAAADMEDGRQVYCIGEGRARVNGLGVDLPVSRRIYYAAKPDLRSIGMEIVLAKNGKTRVDFAHPPAKAVTSLRITVEETFSMVHGAYQGCSDPLPVAGVVKLLEVRQMESAFDEGTDFTRRGDQIDWSPAGAEPANGSTYTARLQYLKDVEPEDFDLDGFSVTGAVPDSQIIFGYDQMLPRYDRLAMDSDGSTTWFKGVANEYAPIPPVVPDTLLALATVYQDWRPTRQLEFDAPCVFSFSTFAALQKRVDFLAQEMARNRLEVDAQSRESGVRKGGFVDPLMDDSMRDQGIRQTAAIVDGMLMLPIVKAENLLPPNDIRAMKTRPWTVKVVLEQLLRTGDIPVNPYMAFDPFPAAVTLVPEVDQWTERQTTWLSAITRQIRLGRTRYTWGWRTTSTSTTTQTISSTTTALEFLRQIDVSFTVEGFGPGEKLKTATFDGIDILAQIGQLTADNAGKFSGKFKIPDKVPAGAKSVVFQGAAGTRGTAIFVGQGNLTVQTLRNVTTQYGDFYEPIAQTFALDRQCWMAGVDLWFTAKKTQARVQLRNIESGMPGKQVMAEAWMEPDRISLNGPTRFQFDCPILLEAGTEYAFVVMCNDADSKCALAQMGKFDDVRQQWVSTQPYTVGVLLSSSNASTWTAHQDMDLAFRILEADFQNSDPLTLNLGKVAIERATDLLLMSVSDLPSAETSCEYLLTLPGGAQHAIAPGQPVALADFTSGEVDIAVKLSGTAGSSPVLFPGTQLIAGTVGESADYYTRSIPATGAIKATLVYEAAIPAGATVKPELQVDGGEWHDMTQTDATPGDDGAVEYTLTSDLTNAQLIKARFTLTGTPLARPTVQNIRLLATA